MTMRLSQNFTVAEFTKSATADRLGVNNAPDVDALANLRRLAVELEKVRAITGKPLKIQSGFRSPAVNVAVGGSTDETLWLAALAQLSCTEAEALARYGIRKPRRWRAPSYHPDGCAGDFDPPIGWTHDELQHAIHDTAAIDFDLVLEEKALDGSHWLHFQISRDGKPGRRLLKDAELERQGGAITRTSAG